MNEADSDKNFERLFKFLKEATLLTDENRCISDKQKINIVSENTLGLAKKILAIVYPKNKVEVQQLVLLANTYKIRLYPVSCGKNIGYGDMLPVADDSVILNLSLMNQISNFDEHSGEVTVEPGVTQVQLYNFLQNIKSKYICDVTGAPTDASIVGNYLEGGFGHTPAGQRKNHIIKSEIILGRGELFNFDDAIQIGPDLNSLWVQSNFGVVVAITIKLFKMPKVMESFVIQFFKSEDFFESIQDLKHLREVGVLQSLVHITNPVRTYMSLYQVPDKYINSYMTSQDCINEMKNPFVKLGVFSAIGGLYGSKIEVALKKRQIKRLLKGRVQFFSDYKINMLKKIVMSPFFIFKSKDKLINNLDTLQYIHNLQKGIPGDVASKNIIWRVTKKENIGLLWLSALIQVDSSRLQQLLKISDELFKKYKFEMPLTVTLVSHKYFIAIFSINFDKSNIEQKQSAYDLYFELKKQLQYNNMPPYRVGLLDKAEEIMNPNKLKLLSEFKSIFDPNKIISPKRYGVN